MRRGMVTVGACVAGALVASCSSDAAPTALPAPFAQADCQGQLVEVARFPYTHPEIENIGMSNDLATDGATLFLAYSYSDNNALVSSGLPSSGGVVAIPLSGGPPQVVAAVDGDQNVWQPGTFWAAAGQIYAQTGTELTSVPADVTTPATLPIVPSDGQSVAYAHDTDFGYYAVAGQGISVVAVPIGGGTPAVLATEPLGSAVGGMADAGDALLLQAQWLSDGEDQLLSGVWRIPKDGSPRSNVRTDVHWAGPSDLASSSPRWLAFDGQDILAPAVVDYRVIQARVAAAGTSPPQPLRLDGPIVTRRGDEILTLQRVEMTTSSSPLLAVASSKGAPAGQLLACGCEAPVFQVGMAQGPAAVPVGIAATDDDIYVAYANGNDIVVARVAR